MIPESITNFLADSLNIHTSESTPLSGGDINSAAKLFTGRGELFLKWNEKAPSDMFEKEALGLKLLREAGSGIKVPKVITYHSSSGKLPGFLLMEFIKPGNGLGEESFNFGTKLAELHRQKEDFFGLDHDNYIGRLPQSNKKHDNWISFFTEERIGPQLKAAIDSGKLPAGIADNIERFYTELESIFPACSPSLLHGDLWGGNYFFDSGGNGVLIDPAVYYGHPEMDIAFTRMFGGFSAEFYEGYESITPITEGFEKRIPVYNLYPLLVHVNLFGGGYTDQAESFLKRF